MKRFISLILFVLFFLPFEGEAQDIIKKGEPLNLERCIEIAVMKNPAIVAAKNSVNVNQSRVGQAEANYYPQVNWTGGYKRYSSASGITSSATSSGLSSNGSSTTSSSAFDQYSSSFSLSQNIYDFGKTPVQVRIQNLNLDSSRSDFENVSEQVILSVKQTYYSVLQAKRNRNVSVDTVKQFQQHLDQAKGFFEVGVKPKFDVTKAEVDLSNARLNLIRAENALRLALVNLNNAMGVPDAPEYSIEDNLSFQKFDITIDNALSNALKNRHDLKSITSKKEAAENNIELAKKGYYPVLTGSAAYSWTGEKIDSLDNGWSVGAAVTFPIFSGFLTKHQVEEAKANLEVLRANEESLKQTVMLEIQQAYLNLEEAEERIPAAELTVKQATENFEIANGRYSAGVGNPIEVTDAQVALSNAKTTHIQALYDYKVAKASLEKAMGAR